MLACEESASIVWARVMRGTSSIGERADAARGQCLDQLGPVERPQVGDDERARRQRGDLVVVGRRDAQHDVGAGQGGGGVGDELGAGERVALVGEPGRVARAALEAHAQPVRGEARDLVGGERDPSLAVCPLAADGDEHAPGAAFSSAASVTPGCRAPCAGSRCRAAARTSP